MPSLFSDNTKKTAMTAVTAHMTDDHSALEMRKQLGLSWPTLYNNLRHRMVVIGQPT